MSKAHRGKGLRGEAAHGRGTCPVCKKEHIKVLYEMEIPAPAEGGEAKKVKICKVCKAAVKHGKKKVA